MFRTPFILPLFFPALTWRVKTSAKELFLTFDDGPIPGPTEFVLDTLKQFNAKATFFCIGDNIRKHPEIARRIIADDHQIANHTFNHLKGWGTSTEKYVSNVALCKKEIENWLPENDHELDVQLGVPIKKDLFRPPYGRIRSKQINALKDQYKIVMWDVLTSDYSQLLSPENCLRGTINAVRPGSIIVFHDSLKAQRNMTYALP
ncbi:MAG: polysaccharide deacetylase family protein, partial [Cyclobacteriaceae bacterium]|nr:polysaccharide deacetylase family protein [Cyclobacteriaceae bacterium]